jgi:hypothetical protein
VAASSYIARAAAGVAARWRTYRSDGDEGRNGAAAMDELLDLHGNTLREIPGVGPVMAARTWLNSALHTIAMIEIRMTTSVGRSH